MTETRPQSAPATSAPAPAASPSAKRNPATDIALIAVFAAFIAVAAIVSIPVGAVPITLQTFAVLLTGAVLGASRGFLAVLLYLAVGAIGLPIFSGGAAGLAPFAGPSVGYILSFPLAAWLTGLLVARIPRKNAVVTAILIFLAALAANIVFVYPLGIAGMMWRAELSFNAAFVANLTFIPLDLVKMALAAIVATAVHRAFPALLPSRAARARVA